MAKAVNSAEKAEKSRPIACPAPFRTRDALAAVKTAEFMSIIIKYVATSVKIT
jgi:hypothetical protein